MIASAAMPLLPCPNHVVIAKQVATALKTTQPIEVLSCAPARLPGVGWFIAARDGTLLHHVALSSEGKLVADTRQQMTADEPVRLRGVDFDGDGVDELVEDTRHHKGDVIDTHVEVRRLEGASLASVATFLTSHDEAATHCEAGWSVGGTGKWKELVITSTMSSGPDAKQCSRTNRNALAGTVLAPATDKWDKALADTRGFRDKMCACKDAACTASVHQQYKDWEKQIMTTFDKDEVPPTSVIEQAEKIEKEMRDCRHRFQTPSTTP